MPTITTEELASEKQMSYLRDLLWKSSQYFVKECYLTDGDTYERHLMMRNWREWQHAIAFVSFIRLSENLTKKQASSLITVLNHDAHPGRFMAALYGQKTLRDALGEVAAAYWQCIHVVVSALLKLSEDGEDISALVHDDDAAFITEMLNAYLTWKTGK